MPNAALGATGGLTAISLVNIQAEVYTAPFRTTLTQSVGSGRQAVISVAATSAVYGTGQFSIAIYDAGTDANPVNFEALQVIGGGATLSWTVVTESGWASLAHASGSTVLVTVMTPRSIQAPLNNHVTPSFAPDPHTQYLRKATFQHPGDLLVGQGNGSFTVLPTSGIGTALITDPTQPTGVRWSTTNIFPPGFTNNVTLQATASLTAIPLQQVFGPSGPSHSQGLAPDPGSSAGTTRFLREDATWDVPPTMVASGASHAPGYAPDPGASAGTSRFLREDATWQTPAGGGGGSGGSGGSIVPIQTQTAAGATPSFTFNVPAGFKNLRITGLARGDTSATSTQISMQANGDTGSNYDSTDLFGSATAGATVFGPSASGFIADMAAANAPASAADAVVITIPNHANTTFQKSATGTNTQTQSNTPSANNFAETWRWRWRSTAAITSLTLTPGAGNFVAGSSFTLWGEADIAPVLLTSNSNLIQETILTSAQATIPIPSIPQGYKDLRIAWQGRSDAAVQNTAIQATFNGDAGAHYDWNLMFANGGSTTAQSFHTGGASASSVLVGSVPGSSAASGTAGAGTITVPNYIGTTFDHGVFGTDESVNNLASNGIDTEFWAGRWNPTSPQAITSIILSLASGNFIAGSVIRVYGEPAAAAGPSVGTGTRTRLSANQTLISGLPTVIPWGINDSDANNQHLLNPAPGTLSGTVSTTLGSQTISGSSTSFTTQLAVGQVIQVGGPLPQQFVVISIASNTSLTASQPATQTVSAQTAVLLSSAIVFPQAGMYDVDVGAFFRLPDLLGTAGIGSQTTLVAVPSVAFGPLPATVSTTVTLQLRLNGSLIISQIDDSSMNSQYAKIMSTKRQFQQWDYVEVIATQWSGIPVTLLADERTSFATNGRPTIVAAIPYINIQDQKSSGTNGGTFTSGAWQQHNLTTIVSDATGLSTLVSNQVTLPPGTYETRGRAAGSGVNRHQTRLQNVTDGVTLAIGLQEYATTAQSSMTTSEFSGQFTIYSSKTLELQSRCETTGTSTGYGFATSWGTEVYAVLEFWKQG